MPESKDLVVSNEDLSEGTQYLEYLSPLAERLIALKTGLEPILETAYSDGHIEGACVALLDTVNFPEYEEIEYSYSNYNIGELLKDLDITWQEGRILETIIDVMLETVWQVGRDAGDVKALSLYSEKRAEKRDDEIPF